jgi:hypothetical protein
MLVAFASDRPSQECPRGSTAGLLCCASQRAGSDYYIPRHTDQISPRYSDGYPHKERDASLQRTTVAEPSSYCSDCVSMWFYEATNNSVFVAIVVPQFRAATKRLRTPKPSLFGNARIPLHVTCNISPLPLARYTPVSIHLYLVHTMGTVWVLQVMARKGQVRPTTFVCP